MLESVREVLPVTFALKPARVTNPNEDTATAINACERSRVLHQPRRTITLSTKKALEPRRFKSRAIRITMPDGRGVVIEGSIVSLAHMCWPAWSSEDDTSGLSHFRDGP